MKPLKITSKFQTTIPRDVREKLNIKAGDSVIFEIVDDQNNVVILKKVKPLDTLYLKSLVPTFSEWNSQEDDEAFDDLQNL